MVANVHSPQFSGGANIAIKCPAHTYDQTVAFYRDTLALPLIEEEMHSRSLQPLSEDIEEARLAAASRVFGEDLQEVEALSMVAVVEVDVGVERTSVDDQCDAATSAASISSIRSEMSE